VKRTLRRYLRRRGASDAEIDAAARHGSLSLLVLDRAILPGEPKYTIVDLAERAGTDLQTARLVWRAVGFPDLPDDQPALTDGDVEALKSFLHTFAQQWVEGWTIDRALPQARVVSAALARVADTVTDEIARSLHAAAEAGVSDEELAALLAERVDISDIAALIVHVYRLQLRAAVWRRLGGGDPDDPGTVTVGVGFVDLVGYTALVQMLDDPELADLVLRFGDLTHDTVVSAGGRIVKTIGDEIMFVSDTPESAADIALKLVEQTRTDDVLPEVRAGVAYGAVLSREGDYFGPVVNLASRLTGMARPGSVLVSAELAAAIEVDPGLHLRRISARKIRDIGRVDVYRLERKRR
jgi:adenylate cyclase